MVAVPLEFISTDERGVAYISGTRMKVSQIAVDKEVLGRTPEEIQESYTHLSLAQIYAALSYYYANKGAIDAYVADTDRYVEEMRAKATTQVTRQELLARRERRSS